MTPDVTLPARQPWLACGTWRRSRPLPFSSSSAGTSMADDARPSLAPHRTTRKALRTHPGDRQCVDDRNRVVIDERQKRARRSLGPAPLLFPTLECAESDTEGTCELVIDVRMYVNDGQGLGPPTRSSASLPHQGSIVNAARTTLERFVRTRLLTIPFPHRGWRPADR